MRGLAALSVVGIHTAFKSGTGYVPEWFMNLTLFFDVPFFFYLSGWASSYHEADVTKTGKSILRIWLKWIFFVTVLAIGCKLISLSGHQIVGITDARDFANNLMFHVSFPGLSVVAGSIWFMPYYFVVVLVNASVLMLMQQRPDKDRLHKFYMWLLLFTFVWAFYGNYVFGLDITYFCFYAFFWMLGYNNECRTKRFWKMAVCVIGCAAGVIFTSYLQGLPLHDIQDAKFPPAPKYVFVSLVAILFFRWLEPHIRKNSRFLVHIGKNAIFYYFDQGVGSSLCFYFVDKVAISAWFLKWLVMLAANLAMTICISELLAVCYKWLEKLILVIRNEKVIGKI